MSTFTRRGWVAPPALFGVFFLLPVIGLAWFAITDGDVAAELGSSSTWDALRLSVLTATLTLFLAVVLGTPLAYLLAASEAGWARLTATLLDLPVWCCTPVGAGSRC